ncbi:MAG: methyltransferase domain-containing protein [Alphaproteobacteria bacterium]|nr:MAG: methyltransferase domain-containing protein [Alphaproteobacteria bacterium]
MRDAIALFYKGAMQQHKNNDGFTQRLNACIERVGGKRAMANAALISEAQLFRYVNAVTQVPRDRLVAIAQAAGVDAGWLLTGEGSASGEKTGGRPSFRNELMVQVVQLLEELLIEFEKPFNPRQRALAITYLYNAFRHEEVMRNSEYSLSKFDILRAANLLAELRTEQELQLLISAQMLLEYSGKKQVYSHEELELLRTWCNMLVRGVKGYYSSYPGQVYFERRQGGALTPATVLQFQNLVVDICKLTGKSDLDWLDLGCGSGRHLVHIHKHMPNIHLKGIELSQLGHSICKGLMDSEKLPKDSIVMGDMRQLPFASNSFDVIYAHMSMYCLPYMRGTGFGLEEAMTEAVRTLRKNGVMFMMFPEGDWREYSLPHQLMTRDMMRHLAADFGLEIVQMETYEELPSADAKNLDIPSQMKLNFNRFLRVLVQKKA